ncbi:MAG: ribosome assembly RNA-binding protein YhbY [Sandaracinaceae bacterium]|nr:ribosome assembly RNA-binding protein YhbY [Sandaracinaceae bacterium]
MSLRGSQKRYLRGLAHHLQPIVQVGKAGITEALISATSRALLDHELIKVRLPQVDKAERAALAEVLEQRTSAQLAGLTGRIAILYRRHPDEPTIRLPE